MFGRKIRLARTLCAHDAYDIVCASYGIWRNGRGATSCFGARTTIVWSRFCCSRDPCDFSSFYTTLALDLGCFWDITSRSTYLYTYGNTFTCKKLDVERLHDHLGGYFAWNTKSLLWMWLGGTSVTLLDMQIQAQSALCTAKPGDRGLFACIMHIVRAGDELQRK